MQMKQQLERRLELIKGGMDFFMYVRIPANKPERQIYRISKSLE